VSSSGRNGAKRAQPASQVGPRVEHDLKEGNVGAIAVEEQTTWYRPALFPSSVVLLLVKARSDVLLLQCVGRVGW
jgi:hypothetical protein